MNHIAPFHVMKILARAREMERQGRDIVHMEVGEPDFSTPEPIVQAGIESLQRGETHYTPAVGLKELREAISEYYRSQFSLQIPIERIMVTPGGSGALQLILAALINPGDEVLITDPGYPGNRHIVRLFGGETRMIPLEEADDFQLDAAYLARQWQVNTRAVMLTNPSNPTGHLLQTENVAAIQHLVVERDGAAIFDEVYQGLVYGRDPETALGLSQENVFVVNSFSKYFGMTGWRLGWLVAPEQFIDAMDRIAQNIFLAAPTTAQHAALSAFQPETLGILEQRRQIFQQRRDYLYEALTRLGFGIPSRPEGAFYLYANVSRFTDDSFEFAGRLLEEAGVAVTPGKDFGSHKAEQFIRFAYTTDTERLGEGVARISKFIEQSE